MSRDFRPIEWDEALTDDCRQLVRLAVREDLDRLQDWTTVSLVGEEATARAAVVAREPLVVAGLPAARLALDEMNGGVNWSPAVEDGQFVAKGTTLAIMAGTARSMLTSERIVLNLLGRLCGVATLTREYVEAVAGTKARVYDTRKTTPGWRRLEKYAVHCGGGHNHRTGLYDAILIKDNHLALGGAASGGAAFSPAEAVRRARAFVQELFPNDDRRDMIVEVEVDTLAQLDDVLTAGPDIVLLDNMPPEMLREAVRRRDAVAPAIELEASGGVRLETIRAIAETGVDRISAGALTHAAHSVDVALDWLS